MKQDLSNRTHLVKVYLNDSEYEKVCKMVKGTKNTNSNFFRQQLRASVFVEFPPNEFNEIICELSRDEAVVAMVDSNLQRERILPSEKAFAYKIKLDALKHQGKSSSRQLVGKSETADIISEDESGRQVQRYIRLTNLIPELLQYVDDGRIALTPAVALSYLTEKEQRILLSNIEYLECTPSYSQAIKLKELSIEGEFNDASVIKLLSEEKPNQKERIKIPMEKIEKYFPRTYTAAQIEEEIVKLCEAHHKKQEKKRGEAR